MEECFEVQVPGLLDCYVMIKMEIGGEEVTVGSSTATAVSVGVE